MQQPLWSLENTFTCALLSLKAVVLLATSCNMSDRRLHCTSRVNRARISIVCYGCHVRWRSSPTSVPCRDKKGCSTLVQLLSALYAYILVSATLLLLLLGRIAFPTDDKVLPIVGWTCKVSRLDREARSHLAALQPKSTTLLSAVRIFNGLQSLRHCRPFRNPTATGYATILS